MEDLKEETTCSKWARCQICSEATAKYKCPRCLKQTCSLACVKQHKVKDYCDGIRDKTAYMPIKSFTDLNLLSDYRFLEDTGRKADSTKRDPVRWHREPKKCIKRMVTHAKKNGTLLQILPHTFTKRRKNSSMLHYDTKKLRWHIEWFFPQEDATFSTRRIPEDTLLSDPLFSLISSPDRDPVVRHRLRAYRDLGERKLLYLLRAEADRSKSKRYHLLDPNKTLSENFREKTIVEYPCITVVFEDTQIPYLVIQQDGSEKMIGDKNENTMTEENDKESVDTDSDSDMSTDDSESDSDDSSASSYKDASSLSSEETEKEESNKPNTDSVSSLTVVAVKRETDSPSISDPSLPAAMEETDSPSISSSSLTAAKEETESPAIANPSLTVVKEETNSPSMSDPLSTVAMDETDSPAISNP